MVIFMNILVNETDGLKLFWVSFFFDGEIRQHLNATYTRKKGIKTEVISYGKKDSVDFWSIAE